MAIKINLDELMKDIKEKQTEKKIERQRQAQAAITAGNVLGRVQSMTQGTRAALPVQWTNQEIAQATGGTPYNADLLRVMANPAPAYTGAVGSLAGGQKSYQQQNQDLQEYFTANRNVGYWDNESDLIGGSTNTLSDSYLRRESNRAQEVLDNWAAGEAERKQREAEIKAGWDAYKSNRNMEMSDLVGWNMTDLGDLDSYVDVLRRSRDGGVLTEEDAKRLAQMQEYAPELFGSQGQVDDAALDAYAKEWDYIKYSRNQGERVAEEDPAEVIRAQFVRDNAQRELDYRQRMQGYDAYRSAGDYEALSRYNGTQPTKEQSAEAGFVSGREGQSEADVAYLYLNDEAYRSAAQGNMKWLLMQYGENGQGIANDRSLTMRDGLDKMTDQQKKTFTYLYQAGLKDKAEQYLTDVREQNKAIERAAENDYNAQYGYEHPWLGSALSVGTNLANAAIAPQQVLDALTRDEVDLNSAAYSMQAATGALRGGAGSRFGSDFEKATGLSGEIMQWLYQAGMSGVDNVAAMALMAPLGLAGQGAFQGGVQLLMSSNAASSQLAESTRRGRGAKLAVLDALVAGGTEALTEKWSLEALMAEPETLLGFLAKNFAAEASEEGASKLLGTLYDEITGAVLGVDTALTQEYRQLLAKGVSAEDAKKQVALQYTKDLLSEMAAGGLSGVALGGGSAAVQGMTGAFDARNIGKELMDTKSQEALLRMALSMDENRATGQLLKKLKITGETDPSKLKGTEMGKIWRSMVTELMEKDAEAADTVKRMAEPQIRAALEALGVSPENLDAGVEAVMNLTVGQMPTDVRQLQAYADEAGVQEVLDILQRESVYQLQDGEEMTDWRADLAGTRRRLQQRLDAGAELAELLQLREQRNSAAVQAAKKRAQKLMEQNTVRADAKETSLNLKAKVGGQEAEILRIGSIDGDGNAEVVVKMGGEERTISLDALKVTSGNTAQILAYAAEAGLSVQEANMLLQGYRGGKAMNVSKYLEEAAKWYEAGLDGTQMPKTQDGAVVDESLGKLMYEAGQEERKAQFEERAKRAEEMRGKMRERAQEKVEGLAAELEAAQKEAETEQQAAEEARAKAEAAEAEEKARLEAEAEARERAAERAQEKVENLAAQLEEQQKAEEAEAAARAEAKARAEAEAKKRAEEQDKAEAEAKAKERAEERARQKAEEARAKLEEQQKAEEAEAKARDEAKAKAEEAAKEA